ncbi:bifunctional tRNA (5-methylaminomethyl-2-thiouridine)(34)-methyltransferase MnmD/FAD-dependent 5-carboxymethylaminomethyl-2-thiouridine(34) oxidoreductase MnmC [Marinospirillum insulare]|uniref:tRNA 5-methylaminomethyl-2-thiouridine biosynthesis bifunctional protein MnmC n=1 Tax=Marinospirillum insulare TaxID=217169 RepID=A0ABQ5ZZ28_9GAMM|nr:bifunctional tRNA (5-methylaminomethyl-2-thiouridine)(34)-methyltransferase MnmD/FAD-dependent 5-carboxymethylaminomethyl-2-thiouridine(34) oxidoreductase MnmC [Marinospirillum insulare]GLR65209.1 tRNA 5-methylaminomethyl-2-thiouridine biosynthesis bifunctional protein MnmC [Marinospirillum insulare]
MPTYINPEFANYQQPRQLETASLDWQATTPLAESFDDVYFSRDQGIAESNYVFLQQNNLPERWQTWQAERAFVMGETGFGTGLNLLVAMASFLKTAPVTARLHWISTELYPLTPEDLKQAHAFWPELAEYAELLQKNYPLPISGFHRLNLHPRITLDLLLGDAATNLSGLAGRVDAWCLDGFAPSKNPSMWTDNLFSAIGQASDLGTTFATFTAAGLVRRGLAKVGFQVKKVKGFGRKREMLRGIFSELPATKDTPNQPPLNLNNKIAIVGAGLSGLATAQALIKRGFKVDMYEAKMPAAGGSGNKQGALYIKLAVDANPSSRFYLAGLEFSRRWLESLDPEQTLWSPSGVLQLATNEREAKRQQRFLVKQQLPKDLVTGVNQKQASELAGTNTSAGGLFFSRAGWVKPKQLCEQLVKTCKGLKLYSQQKVTDLAPVNPADKKAGWQMTTASGKKVYQQVVICCADAAKAFTPSHWLPVTAVRGQVSYLSLNQTDQSLNKPNSVVCGKGYTLPPTKSTLCFGASFDANNPSSALSQADQLQNQQELTTILPNLLAELEKPQTAKQELDGRVSFRCASPDYLPLVGQLADLEAWQKGYQSTQSSWAVSDFPNNWSHSGLWLNLGHGSRGLASIPISAELLASQLVGEPAPFEQELVDCLNPARFILKDLKRQKP